MGKPSDTGEGEASRPGTLDDGFNLIAKDLDRAFCLGLSTNQAVIMNCVREQSWTASLLARRKGEPRPQPVPAKVNLTHLAADAGLNRSSLSLALKALIAGGLLACIEGGHLIKKDYSKWLDDDGKAPRFTPAQLRFIRAAKTPKKDLLISDISTQLPLQSATVGAEVNSDIDTQLPLQSATVGAKSAENVAICNGKLIDTQLPLQSATVGPESAVAKRNSAVGSPLQSATATVAKRNSAPLEERASEDLKTLIQFKTPLPPEGDDDDDLAQLPDPGTPDVKKPNLPFLPDPAVVSELEELSRIVLGDRGEWGSFYTHVRGWLVSFPADWVRNAIYCLGANPKVKSDGLAFYALKCFRNWNAHGLGEKDARDIEAGRRKFAPAASPAADDYKPMTAEDIEFEKVLREGERRRAEKIALEKGKKPR